MSLCVILFYKDIMLEELIKIDQQILLLFNRYHTVYWDQVMWVYTGKYIWIPLILSFVWVYFRKNWKDALWTILMMILVVTVCDQFASTICKPYQTGSRSGLFSVRYYCKRISGRKIRFHIESCCECCRFGNFYCVIIQK